MFGKKIIIIKNISHNSPLCSPFGKSKNLRHINPIVTNGNTQKDLKLHPFCNTSLPAVWVKSHIHAITYENFNPMYPHLSG